MRKIELGEKFNIPIVLALGFFDCIHLGHRLLVDTAKDMAKSMDAETALFTFSNDPNSLLGYEKQIYTFEERAAALDRLGLQNLIYTVFDNAFAEKSPIEFLDTLTENLNIKGIVVGKDYSFGKKAEGNVELLKKYCVGNGIELQIKEFATSNGNKISTRSLKSLVKTGNIAQLNTLLTEPYFVLGVVEHERHVGSSIGFPTANICVDRNKLPVAEGIYATKLYVDGKCYNSMTNVGGKPTFDVDKRSIEAFIFDFDGDIYGKSVKLSFYARTREVTKFASAQDLQNQLKNDELQIKEILNDLE